MVASTEFLSGLRAGLGLTAGVAGILLAYEYWRKSRGSKAPFLYPTMDPSFLQGDHHEEAEVAELPEEETKDQGSSWKVAREKLHAGFLRKHPQGFGCDVVLLHDMSIDNVFLLPVPHLSEYFADAGSNNRMGLSRGGDMQQDYNKLMGKQDVIIHDIVRKAGSDPVTTAYLRAGPRKNLHFDPSKVRAAIVTCGGLCPGLNNIIQGVVRTLLSLYGAEKVIGVPGGYGGFNTSVTPIELTLANVAGIHNMGGTIIGSGRGSFDLDKTFAYLKYHRINQLYVVGGDGTHRAANKVAEEARRLKLNIAVCGVPKTIDNDIDLLDRSFGFNTAVEEAQKAIQSAAVEAQCNMPNGIGIVKLMGRHSGFIAVHAALCSGEVDLCLVPEVPVVPDGEKGILPYLEKVVDRKGNAVVVVAEGAGEDILGKSATVDAGGNRKLPELGMWLKDEINKHFEKRSKPVTVKYIDPSYMIRSVPANAGDAIYCLLLAQNAVHGTMAGYTSFSVGMANNRLVYIPINSLVKNSPRMMDPMGRTWERVVSVTGQPNTARALDTAGGTRAINTRTAF